MRRLSSSVGDIWVRSDRHEGFSGSDLQAVDGLSLLREVAVAMVQVWLPTPSDPLLLRSAGRVTADKKSPLTAQY